MPGLPVLVDPTEIDRRPQLALQAKDVDTLARSAGVPIRCLGVGPLPAKPLGFAGETDWVVLPAGQDPLILKQEMAIPAQQRKRLERLASAGVAPTTLLIGHELPGGSIDPKCRGGELSKADMVKLHASAEVPAPRATVKLSHRLGGLAQKSAQTAIRAAGVAIAGVAAVAAAPLLLAELDPVVIGAFTETGTQVPGEPALLVVLAEWDW